MSPYGGKINACCILLHAAASIGLPSTSYFILIHSFIHSFIHSSPCHHYYNTTIPPANQSIIPDLSDPSSFPCVKMTTAATEYNNDDEWHIHRDSMLGLSPGGISNTFFNDAAVDDEDDEPEPGEEFELVDDVAVDTGFFDEEDVIGYYVSYDQHDANNNNNNDDDDDDDSGEEDEDEEEFIPPCPPVDPMAATATATSFRTPTTPTTTTTATTTRPQDDRAVTASSTTTKANANAAASTEPKRKRTRRDPNKPKGWLSPVFLYSNANRAKVKSENPDASFGDIVSVCFPRPHIPIRILFHTKHAHTHILFRCKTHTLVSPPSPLMILSAVFSRRNTRIYPPTKWHCGNKRRIWIRHVIIARWKLTIIVVVVAAALL